MGRDVDADVSAGADSIRRWRVEREIRTSDGVRVVNEAVAGLEEDARRAAFERVLAKALGKLRSSADAIPDDAPVVVSGMASSTVGWKELPYAATPCGLDGEGLRVEPMSPTCTELRSRPVWMVSGLRTDGDIMRGEETELLGLFALPELAAYRTRCRVLLPGTHSKHVRVESGRILDFRTYLTGELLEVLSTQSLLRVSVTWPPPSDMTAGVAANGTTALRDGVRWAKDAGLARGLFQVRVRSVLRDMEAKSNAWFLAGLVLGAEVIDLLDWADGESVVLAGPAHFSGRYRAVFEALGQLDRLTVVPPEDLVESTARAHAVLLRRVLAARTPPN